MTIQRSFFNWSFANLDFNAPEFERMQPNLLQLNSFLRNTWGGQPLGLDDYDRPIRGGTAPSAHAAGAALDWRYSPTWLTGTTAVDVGRTKTTGIVIPWLINNSLELGIDAIHDYVGDRIWRAGRTALVSEAHTTWWKKQNGAGEGMGESWAKYLHIETTHAARKNATPVVLRPGIKLPTGVKPIPIPQPKPEPPKLIVDEPPPTLVQGVINPNNVRWLQQILNERFGTTLTVDGVFGPATTAGVVRMQQILDREITDIGPADGVYGPRTANALGTWLDRH